MRTHQLVLFPIFIAALALSGCSRSDQPDKAKSKASEPAPRLDLTIPEGMGAIHITTGPYSPEIVSKAFYQMREAFPIQPFELGRYQYVLSDSIATRDVIGFAETDGFELVMDSANPGIYNLILYVSRLGRAQVMPDTVIGPNGDTTITDPVKNMPPYDYYFRPVFVDSLVVTTGLISLVDLSGSLEKWERPRQLETGWEAPRARYLKWDGKTATPTPR